MWNNMRQSFSIILVLTWLSGVICRVVPDVQKQKVGMPKHVARNPHLTNYSKTETFNRRKIDAGYPEWENDLTFSFEQFPDTNKLNQVKRAMLGVIDMLQTTMAVMYPGSFKVAGPWPAPVSNPSLERYFSVSDLPEVGEVFKRLLAALGAPGYKDLMPCHAQELLTVKVVYGDYGGETTCQTDPNASAYTYWHDDNAHPDGSYQVLSLCPPFFNHYKDYSGPVPLVLFTAPNIDPGISQYTYDIPCFTSSLHFLHELLHWAGMGASALGFTVDDQVIFSPHYNAETKAYRAFYSMKLLDSIYNVDNWTPLSNVDNYVYAVQEIYWGQRTRRTARNKPWNDPPRIQGYFPPDAAPPP